MQRTKITNTCSRPHSATRNFNRGGCNRARPSRTPCASLVQGLPSLVPEIAKKTAEGRAADDRLHARRSACGTQRRAALGICPQKRRRTRGGASGVSATRFRRLIYSTRVPHCSSHNACILSRHRDARSQPDQHHDGNLLPCDAGARRRSRSEDECRGRNAYFS